MTVVLDAQAALVDRLEKEAVAGGPLDGVQVAYSWRASTATNVMIYGGRTSFEPNEAEDLGASGTDVLPAEVGRIDMHIRVHMPLAEVDEPETAVRQADQTATRIAGVLRRVVQTEPRLAGRLTNMTVAGGGREYAEDDDSATVILTMTVAVDAYVTS
jgi:hypothetical protein